MKTCAALVILGSLTRLAFADERVVTLERTCVEIDGSDQLVPADRELSARLLQQVLEREDLLVVTSDCVETYVVSHERTADRYVIRLRSSAGKRKMTVANLEDLYTKYQRLTRSLIEAKSVTAAALEPLPAAAPSEPPAPSEPASAPPVAMAPPHDVPTAADDEPTTTTEPPPRRSMWYALIGAQPNGGFARSIGYRRDFADAPELTLDVSVAARDGGDFMEAAEGFSLGVELLRNKQISSGTRFYGGGGLSVGGEDRTNNQATYSGAGLQGELTTGVALAAGSRLRVLFQIDVTLPFYQMTSNTGDTDYSMGWMISGGLGW